MVHRLRLVSAIAWTLIILVLCWTPREFIPDEEQAGFLLWIIPFKIDKVVHVGIFAVFSVFWLRATKGWRGAFPWIVLGGVALAVISELGQESPIVQRDATWMDGLADLVGLLLGFPAFFLLERYMGRLAVRPPSLRGAARGARLILIVAPSRARRMSPLRRSQALLLSLLLSLSATPAQAQPEAGPNRKLIEFGWDEPDTAFLRAHLPEMERTPFDGCVFHVNTSTPGKTPENLTWLAWGRRRFTDDEVSAARADLKAIGRGRFAQNFLRFNVTPADLDWFDDHGAVMANARLAASLAREGPCRGILLDTEQYENQLFNYQKQRDASRRSWDEYAAQVRQRGRELITALQEGFPGLTVLVTFGPSLVWNQGERDGGKTPIAARKYGLLVPFFDGLINGLRPPARIVDGYEPSYGYRERARFEHAREVMTAKAASLMADPESYRRAVAPGFGLWLDYDWRKRGWKLDDLDANHFSPSRFQESVRAALEITDEFVWIYTETPRWWTAEGKTVALPGPYVAAVRAARKGLCAD